MAVRDDDPVDATLEGAPVVDDTGDSQVLFASAESPLAPSPPRSGRGAPPPVTLPDMPAVAPPSASESTKRKKKKSKSLDSMPPTAPVTTSPGPPPRAPAPLAAMPSAPKPLSAATTTASDLLASAPPAPTGPQSSYNAAATVVASFKDIAAAAGVKLDLTGDGAAVGDGIAFDASGEGGFIFDASAEGAPVDDHGFGDGDGATRPDVARFQDRAPPPPTPAPAPPRRATTPPPTPAAKALPPLPAPADQTSLPPPKPKPLPAPADQTMLPPPTSLPGSPSFSVPRTSTRNESRGGAAGVGGPLDPPVAPPKAGAGLLDPPLPPRKDTRGPVAGVGGPLDPPVAPRREARQTAADGPTDPTRGKKGKRSEASRAAVGDVDVPTVDGGTGGGVGRGLVAFAVVAAIALAVVLLTRGGATAGQTLGPREARALSERARAVLVTKARSDVEDPVRGVVRTLVGEGGRAIVVREAAADAFTLPDGTVVVTDGLLQRLGSDGQLAAVCAHVLAHHQLGHVAGLSDALDGPAVVAALRAHGTFDEAAADAAAAVLLLKGGWKTSGLVDAQAALPEDAAWVRRHRRRPEQIAGAVGAGGGTRDDRDWYRQKIVDVLAGPAAPTPAPPPPPTSTTID